MTLAQKIENIVTTLYPSATFLLSSEFEADYESYFKDENTLIVLNNELDEEDIIQENVNFLTKHRIQISVYLKDEFDTKNKESNLIVDQAKEISRKIYFNIWLLPDINAEKSDGKIFHKPVIKAMNSIRTGVLSLANWNTKSIVSC